MTGSRSDRPFLAVLGSLALMYLLLILAMLVADGWYAANNVTWSGLLEILGDRNIQFSIKLTLITCTVTALLSILVAVPTGYLLSRYRFPGKLLIDAALDIPIVLPPLVVGLSLLILFNHFPDRDHNIEKWLDGFGRWSGLDSKMDFNISYTVFAVIIAQFSVACAFAVRTMRNTFDQISPRTEQVAQTLGCSRVRAFFSVVIPEAWRGISTAGTLAWTRAMGEFGPILVFAAATPRKTEVLSSTVYLEISTGSLEKAVVVSLMMVTIAVIVLIAVRIWDKGAKGGLYHD